MQALQIIASSWPIAIMFLSLVIAGVIGYFLHWMNVKDEQMYVRRSENAVAVKRNAS